MAGAMERRILICSTCAGDGAGLAEALAGLNGWAVEMHPCLSVCEAPVALAAQAAGRATYVFAGLTPQDAGDVRSFAAAYEAAPAGWIEDARPLGRLRFCLRSRVPALPVMGQ